MSPEPPELTTLQEALAGFAFPDSGVQTSRHIRRLHWYVASRLVIEGGFHPDLVLPRPPIAVEVRGKRRILHHDPESAKPGERIILGGLKTKQLDVTVDIPWVGPALAVSLKGTHNAIRNLTNRMEEAAGDCTNLHMAYPALVYGFWHVIRANEEDDPSPHAHFPLKEGRYNAADLAVLGGGEPIEGVCRYAQALERLSDRVDLREQPAQYEACGLTLVRCRRDRKQTGIFPGFPVSGTVLDCNRMFRRLYETYDRRFIYQAPALKRRTARNTWDPESPLLADTVLQSEAFAEMNPRID